MNGFVQAVKDKKVLFLGHQGAYGEVPPNSMSGFRKAIEMGAHGIETDLHGTKDGRIVLMHDDEVFSVTLSTGKLTEMTYEEVCRLNVAEKFRPGFEAEKVPTLDELLELTKPVEGFLLNLEFKDYPERMGEVAYQTVDETIRLVEEAGMGERVMFSTLSCAILKYIIRKYGDRYPIESIYPSFVMVGEFDEEIYEKSLFAGVINVLVREDGSRDWGHAQRVPLLPHEEMEKLKAYGMTLCVSLSPWDTEKNVKWCDEEGVLMYICNYPSNGKEILKKFELI